MEKIKKYENFISLGVFCGVAQDLETLGLRSKSSPFDWCLSEFECIVRLIENKFDGFMKYENLIQDKDHRERYKDNAYNTIFFHDFSKYKPLKNQYDEVKEKYDRRIKNFLKDIEKPTLFIRYILSKYQDENGRSLELNWIEENAEYIESVIKSCNPQNKIIYIGDENIHSDIIKIYKTKIDDNDIVSRNPIINNEELYPIITAYTIDGQEENIKFAQKKRQGKNTLMSKTNKKCKMIFEKHFKRVYVHSKEFSFDKPWKQQ